jgi:hypothetical protein
LQNQVRTIKCGCGNCQLRKNVADTCPQESSKDAIWLWASDFSVEERSNGDDIVEMMEDIFNEAAEEELLREVL